MSFKAPFKVRSYELDSLGHMNNAIYFSYMEEASFVFLTKHNLPFERFKELNYYPILVHAEVDFKVEICSGDQIEVEGWAESYGKTSMTLGYRFWRIDSESKQQVATGKRVWVFVHNKKGKIPVPQEIRRAFDAAGPAESS